MLFWVFSYKKDMKTKQVMNLISVFLRLTLCFGCSLNTKKSCWKPEGHEGQKWIFGGVINLFFFGCFFYFALNNSTLLVLLLPVQRNWPKQKQSKKIQLDPERPFPLLTFYLSLLCPSYLTVFPPDFI